MHGIMFNIICYIFFSLAMVAVLVKYEKDFHQNIYPKPLAWIKFASALLLMFWCFFMVFYLIVDYDNIMASPLNVRLNFFEAITNGILPLYIIGSNFPENIYKIFRK